MKRARDPSPDAAAPADSAAADAAARSSGREQEAEEQGGTRVVSPVVSPETVIGEQPAEPLVDTVDDATASVVPTTSSVAADEGPAPSVNEDPSKVRKTSETDTASTKAAAARAAGAEAASELASMEATEANQAVGVHPGAAPPLPPPGGNLNGAAGAADVLRAGEAAARVAGANVGAAAMEAMSAAPSEAGESEAEDKSVKFENALDFLDQVKVQFQDRPKVYNQFLEIMKDFKAQLVDTPGVIARVQDLFRGHKRLILGFNTFLPAGYKMEYTEGAGLSVTTPQGVVHNIPLSQPGSLTGGVSAALPPETDSTSVLSNQGAYPSMAGTVATPAVAGVMTGTPATARKQPEFDHARNYVKKIKVRFANQPQIYKAFLEILHTYHKEQHTIKDVYEQVAELFESHNDLLDEFQQFLPDPVAQGQQQQQGAAMQVSAARVEKPRKGGSRKRGADGKRVRASAASTAAATAAAAAVPSSKSTQAQSQQTAAQIAAHTAELRHSLSVQQAHAAALQLGAAAGAPSEIPQAPPDVLVNIASAAAATRVVPRGTYEELSFFFRIKQRLEPPVYFEFLKCLNLFSQNIISRMELVLLVRDLLGRHRDLFTWFKQFIGFDDASMAMLQKHDDRFRVASGKPESIRAEDVDIDRCRPYGPSYRAMPRTTTPEHCSGQTDPLYAMVLNDTWSSTASGSEDFGFKNLRKNTYEEMLFKCEDDRFELDLIIEQQAACRKALQLISRQIADLPTSSERIRFRLDRQLDVLHVRVIERLYGDEASAVLESLYRSPASVIPVLVQRMKEKDAEWCNARKSWNAVWREVTERNHYKSLDHQAFYFKNADKKAMNPAALLTQMQEIYNTDLRRRAKEADMTPADHHVFEKMGSASVLRDSITVMQAACTRLLSKADQTRVATFVSAFLEPFFALPTSPNANPTDAVLHPRSSSGLFFGDEAFYVFFRLFQLLYSRLLKAREMSDPSRRDEQAAAKASVAGRSVEDYLSLLNPEAARLREAARTAAGTDPYSSFVRNVLLPHVGPERGTGALQRSDGEPLAVPGVAAVNSRDAAAAYEDASRALFGSEAHILFTLEKLLHHLAHQLQTLLSEDIHSRLLVLYTIEATRITNVSDAEAIYYSNCVDALTNTAAQRGDSTDAQSSTDAASSGISDADRANRPPVRCVRFEYSRPPEPSSSVDGRLTLTILDSRKDPPRFVDFSAAQHARWTQYVEQYMINHSHTDADRSSRAGWEVARDRHVFLLRAARGLADAPAEVVPAPDSESEAASVHAALKGVVANAGVEARISVNTFKLFFVENTSDYLFRLTAPLRPMELPADVARRSTHLDKVAERARNRAAASAVDDKDVDMEEGTAES